MLCLPTLSRTGHGANSLLARAVIAAEDQRFYEHTGYDLVEVAHALRSNQRTTLTSGHCEDSVTALRELQYAVEMEQTLGKARILRLYLDGALSPFSPQRSPVENWCCPV